jgi:hypothetical protein
MRSPIGEPLRCECDRSYPMLRFEQRAYLEPSGEPSHWECGFIRRPTDGDLIEVSTAQDSGRVEVLRGAVRGDGERIFRVELDHVVLAHDPRLVATRRVLRLEEDRMGYKVSMATRTTPQPRLQRHLSAEFGRVTG